MTPCITPEVLGALVALHFLGDFLAQSNSMAVNKSTSLRWLSLHVFIYSLPFLIIFGWKFAVITFALHFVVDFFSSKVTKKFWQKQDYHNFFVIIGLDQMLHMLSLFWTWYYVN